MQQFLQRYKPELLLIAAGFGTGVAKILNRLFDATRADGVGIKVLFIIGLIASLIMVLLSVYAWLREVVFRKEDA